MKKNWWEESDIILGIGALVILGMLIVPLPGLLLDFLIILSIGIGLLILLTAMSVKEPSDFSVFPSILLVTTLYRLALNVSTTRQILSKGPGMGSQVIDAFGTFVIGSESGNGKYVVGFIIFLILTLVQILVITKGATRIAEVAARFTLDALPGKQMSIDLERQNGALTEEQARAKQKKIQKEVDFYGAMDGASKFVQGDVRAGLAITAINLIGGIIIGSTIRGESFGSAIEIYGKYTIGDGLVSQIPSLLTTTATGIIVTRAGSERDFSTDINQQLFKNANVLYILSSFMGLAALIPGLPFLSLGTLAGALAYLAFTTSELAKEETQKMESDEASKSDDRKPENYYKDIRNDPIEVELGLNLVPLVNTSEGGILLSQIGSTRKKFAIETGMVIPAVRILDNLELDPDSYAIKIHGVIVGESRLKPGKLMAVNNQKSSLDGIEGEEFLEPTFGMKAQWIDPKDKIEAESKGYTVVDPSTVLVTHLKELISNHASQLLGREEVKSLLDHVKTTHPTLVQELDVEKAGSPKMGMLQQTLQNLLKEGVSIRNLPMILEAVANTLANAGGRTISPDFLSEQARQAISRQIVSDYQARDGRLYVVTLDPKVADRLTKSVVDDQTEGKVIVIPPDYRNKLLEAISSELKKANEEKRMLIFVTNRYLRMPFANFLSKDIPARNFAVLAVEEVQSTSKTTIASVLNLTSDKEEATR
jgi:flagellar biosynthesis protein FlhA